MDFTAKLLDGRTLTNADVASVSLLPLAEVTELQVRGVLLKADVANGERVNFFIRHAISVGSGNVAPLVVPVFEIKKDDKTLCRLYWHPFEGPLLSSQDLYFS